MAKYVLKNAYVSINAVDLSDHVAQVEIKTSNEDVDVTAMGAAGHQRLAGLADDSVTITFLQDHAAAKVDATLWPLRGAAPFAIEIRSDTAVVGVTNPKWTGNCILTEYTPIQGEVGSRSEAAITMPVDGILTRAIV